jgi:hypothetical protein
MGMKLDRDVLGIVQSVAIETADILDNKLTNTVGIQLTAEQFERIIDTIVNEAVDTVLE